MSYPMYRIWPLLLLGGLVVPGVRHVSGIEIYTPTEVEVVNGTDVKLKCTFTSTHKVSENIIVSWNYRSLNLKSKPDESVFYYHKGPYPTQEGLFKGHVVWSGDIMKRDVSITLLDVQPTFNGSYICQVRNLPDVHGSIGEILLKVVNKVSFSEIGILAAAVGGACGVILLLIVIFVVVRFYRQRHVENDIEMHSREQEWKDSTVCKPEEAVHLKVMAKEKKVDSSDDEESEPSSGDDAEEEEDGQEDDDDDDDDDCGGGDDDDD